MWAYKSKEVGIILTSDLARSRDHMQHSLESSDYLHDDVADYGELN